MAPTWDRLHSSGVELEILHGSGKMRLVKHGQAEEEEEESIWWTSTKHGPHKSIFDASTSYNILVQLGTCLTSLCSCGGGRLPITSEDGRCLMSSNLTLFLPVGSLGVRVSGVIKLQKLKLIHKYNQQD